MIPPPQKQTSEYDVGMDGICWRRTCRRASPCLNDLPCRLHFRSKIHRLLSDQLMTYTQTDLDLATALKQLHRAADQRRPRFVVLRRSVRNLRPLLRVLCQLLRSKVTSVSLLFLQLDETYLRFRPDSLQSTLRWRKMEACLAPAFHPSQLPQTFRMLVTLLTSTPIRNWHRSTIMT